MNYHPLGETDFLYIIWTLVDSDQSSIPEFLVPHGTRLFVICHISHQQKNGGRVWIRQRIQRLLLGTRGPEARFFGC
jgi:hypothetical protein